MASAWRRLYGQKAVTRGTLEAASSSIQGRGWDPSVAAGLTLGVTSCTGPPQARPEEVQEPSWVMHC